MMAYITELVIPVWLIIEPIIQAYRYTKGYDNCLLISMVISLAMALFFTVSLIYSLKRFKNLTLKDSFFQSVVTGLYMLIVWMPTSLFIVFKIIFKKKSMDWGKTEHGLAKNQTVSIDKEESEMVV